MVDRHLCWSSYFFPAPAVALQCSISRITTGLDIAGPELRNTLENAHISSELLNTLCFACIVYAMQRFDVAYMLRALYSNSEGLPGC